MVGVHLFAAGVAPWPLWSRLVFLGVTLLLAVWVTGLLSSDRGQGYLVLTLLGGAGLLKPAISGRELWASFHEIWGGMAPVLLVVQLVGSLIALVAGSLLYREERARDGRGEDLQASGWVRQEGGGNEPGERTHD